MCSSGIVSVLAIVLQIAGVLALLIGFFVSLAGRSSVEGIGAGIFLTGVVMFILGARISGVC